MIGKSSNLKNRSIVIVSWAGLVVWRLQAEDGEFKPGSLYFFLILCEFEIYREFYLEEKHSDTTKTYKFCKSIEWFVWSSQFPLGPRGNYS